MRGSGWVTIACAQMSHTGLGWPRACISWTLAPRRAAPQSSLTCPRALEKLLVDSAPKLCSSPSSDLSHNKPSASVANPHIHLESRTREPHRKHRRGNRTKKPQPPSSGAWSTSDWTSGVDYRGRGAWLVVVEFPLRVCTRGSGRNLVGLLADEQQRTSDRHYHNWPSPTPSSSLMLPCLIRYTHGNE